MMSRDMKVKTVQPKVNIVHLPVYEPGKPLEEVQREFGLQEVIKLASNENPFGFSPAAKEAIIQAATNTHIYPDGGSIALHAALSKHLGVKEEQLIFGNGSDEIILMIARAFLTADNETIMASHTFPQYKHNAEVEGATCIEVPLKDGTHDLDAMLAHVNERTKIIWVCNPNNPTGTMNTDEEIRSFMAQVPDDVLVVMDEAYYEYNTSPQRAETLPLIEQYSNMIILRTFSKIYGLASLRIGYGIGNPEIIRYINQVREPFNTNSFAQAAAIAALQDQAFIEQCRQDNAEGMRYLQRSFDRLGLSYYPAYGNFIMVNIERPAQPVFEALLAKGVIVRSGAALHFPTSLRVTVGSPEQNETFIDALERVLNE